MKTLEEVRARIGERESEAEEIQKELQALKKTRQELEAVEQEEFFQNPRPGDFWHDCFSPVLLVLEVCGDHIVVADKTMTLYEQAEPAMVLKSYETPDDPEVKRYFAKPRKEVGYTFDLDRAKKVSREEFRKDLKCYSSMPDELTYRCVRGGRPSMELVGLWAARPKIDNLT